MAGLKGLTNYKFQVVDYNGNPIPSGLSVTITNSEGVTLTIYKEDQSTSLTNPILSAALDVTTSAEVSFWYSPGGVYAIVSDGHNITRHGPIYEYDHRIVVPYLALLAGGTSTARERLLADEKYIELRVTNSALTGDNRLMYLRYKLDAAMTSGGGETLRVFTEVLGATDQAGHTATAHGAHISLGFGMSTIGGYITGLGVAGRFTLGLPSVAMASGGTYAAIMPEIYSFGAAADAGAVTELSFIRCVNDGDASGIADVDDDAYLLVLTGGATASGNVVVASTTETNYSLSARCKLNGTVCYMMFASAVG